jgi:DNA-binding CsgD family transcriptional regulator
LLHGTRSFLERALLRIAKNRIAKNREGKSRGAGRGAAAHTSTMTLDRPTLNQREFPSYLEVVQSTQARLRDDLFGSPSRIRWRPARDLAAHMLLFVDDSKRCSTIAVEWIRGDLGCSRVDTGLGASSSATYLPGYAEARDPDAEVPTYAGTHVNNMADAMQLMWKTERPIVFRDVAADGRFDARLHDMLVNAGTTSKMAAPVGYRGRSIGLICANWVGRSIPNSSALHEHFESVVGDVLGPILLASHELAAMRAAASRSGSEAGDSAAGGEGRGLVQLTPAELKVAWLAASGLPYKLIADRLNKSFSTVDHQLRSIRQKLKVRTYAELAAVLASSGGPSARHDLL